MVNYHRMGTMEQHLGNPMATTLLHEPRDLWKSPRGTIIRIEALTLVAIALSFFLAVFGSCRRWSNGWIFQKGFLVANILFLSLGTYSIGLMQSSSVKSEMYPIWAASLLSLLCCVDSITAYSLEFKSQLWKMVYQLCLYCGYVLLMSMSTKSSGVCNIAVGVLSTITLMKGFHRIQALVVPCKMQSVIRAFPVCWEEKVTIESAKYVTKDSLVVHLSLDHLEPRSINPIGPRVVMWADEEVTLRQIKSWPQAGEEFKEMEADVCLALSLSHVLQRRFIEPDKRVLEIRTKDYYGSLVSSWIVLRREEGVTDYERAFKVVELELAFMYDIMFTSNAFLHYYQAKTASVWAVASVIGVVFVGVAGVAIPRTTRQAGAVATTTADLIVTGVVVVSLALLQVLQLLRCWTSNWARIAFACDYVRNHQRRNGIQQEGKGIGGWQMRLRASLMKMSHWFHSYLWQNKIGQHSLVESVSKRECNNKLYRRFKGWLSRLSRMLGLVYIEHMLLELFGSSHTGAAVELHADVKAAIVDYFVRAEISNGPTSYTKFVFNTRNGMKFDPKEYMVGGMNCTRLILVWHIATCYCELAQEREQCTGGSGGRDKATTEVKEKDHRRVATLLSRYYAYLMASVPQLLPGESIDTEDLYSMVAEKAGEVLRGAEDKLASMEREMRTMLVLDSMKCNVQKIEKLLTSELDGRLPQRKGELGYLLAEGIYEVPFMLFVMILEIDQWWEGICSWLQVIQDDMGTVKRSMGATEKHREAVGELGAIVDPLQGLLNDVKSRLTDILKKRSETASRGYLESLQRLLTELEEKMKRVAQATRVARDKLCLIEETERESRGMRRCPDPEKASPQDRVFWSGLELGDQLQRQPASQRWETLADFWVMALVYAAPSDNVEEHMQHLAQGGEFITHIWALLFHHGVISWKKEDQRN